MPTLTAYEQQQVRRIAGWKAEPPSYISGLLDKLTHPLVKLAEKALPENTVAEAISDAYASSEVSTHREKVLLRAGVSDLHELRRVDLAVCDRLADEFAKLAEEKAMAAGAGTGGGNLLSAMIVVRSLLGYCLKTIHTVGYCYGFGTEEPHERDYVLGVMLISSAGTLKEKQNAIVTVGNVEEMILEEAFEELIEDAIAEQILSSGGLTAFPAVGILAGALQFATMTQHVARIAKFTFQERWLRANGRLETRIAPDREYARSWARRVGANAASAMYWSTFGLSFLASVPALWMFRFVPKNHALGRGIADGRRVAVQDAVQLVERLHHQAEAAPEFELAPVSAT
ncbi:MAG: EcsC family protein [Planctomycetales bacterium]